ncbi:polar localization protein TipN [Phenylobacterium sp.]|uniref:polar localization protein TipN n=1 Tax=Phenylobacterium sp. TaxID=1871053 RepID=UPI0035AD99C2
MKIKKRRAPLDFGALAGGPSVEFEEAEPLEAAPDFDLEPIEPPSNDDGVSQQAGPVAAPAPERAAQPAPVAARAPEPPQKAREAKPVAARAEPQKPAPAQPQPEARPVEAPKPRMDAPREAPAPRPEPELGPMRPAASKAKPRRPAGAGKAPGRRERPPSAGAIYGFAGLASLGWVGALAGAAWTYRAAAPGLTADPIALAALAALALGPVALIWIAAYLARQGRLLALEAMRAKALADDMVSPAVIAAGRTGDLVQAIRTEIAQAGQTAKEAREALAALREALAAEAGRLAEATSASARAANGLAETLGRERVGMSETAKALEAQSASVVEAIGRQSRVVAEASDLAVTQLRESEASLTARAADLTAAVGQAGDAARAASEDLTRHIARLETAGGGVAEQISVVEAGLVEQRAALVTASQALRADQEVFAAEAESQTAKLSEFIAQARQSASEMGDRAIKGADALRGLIAEAADQFREFAEQAKIERDAFGASTKESLEAVAAGAAEERVKLEAQTRAAIEALIKASDDTRAAAERHAEAARAQVDQLSEAAFTAGQNANQVFETRLAEARDLIERSAQMVEQAGAATARKLDEGATAARGALQELQRMLAEIETRAAQMPAAARQQAEEVRAAVIQGMDELMAHAKRTAEETEAIDLAFQERVRRNYDMLSEAVRLMGTVASTSSPAPREPKAQPPQPAAPTEPLELEAPVEAPQAKKPASKPPAADAGPRPRLRLTPTATDQEFSSVFEAAGGRGGDQSSDAEGWTWKELLSSIDEDPGAVSDARVEDTLISEITSMGIDPAALLPRARVEEIVELLQSDDGDACRTLVRRMAPAATRRLARRLFTDPALKQQVRRYLTRHQRLLADAAKRDKDGLELSALLASDAGRAYLLLDAAAGDAG